MFRLHGYIYNSSSNQHCILCSVYLEHCADEPDVSSDPDLDKPHSSSSSGLLGVAVSVVVLVLAAACVVVLVVWLR